MIPEPLLGNDAHMVHILLVEDDPGHARLIRRVFEAHPDRYCLIVTGFIG